LSLRSVARLGCSLSVFGVARFGSLFSLSVMEVGHMGSAFSLRSFVRMGSSMSVLSDLCQGSSLSIRRLCRLGSHLSLFNCARFGSSISVLDFQQFGSSMSVRGFVRLGSSVSLFSKLEIGYASNDGGCLNFANSKAYIRGFHTASRRLEEKSAEDSDDSGARRLDGDEESGTGGAESRRLTAGDGQMIFYVATAAGNPSPQLTIETDGGILHGSWNLDAALITSDRRLKTNIVPLQRTLRDVIAPRGEQKVETSSKGVPAMPASGKGAAGDGALWLLRQLRPVSYSFRKGQDSKFMRFGFIADELESVVPEVVRTGANKQVENQKAVVYQDLIALLAAASQSQQKLIEAQQSEVSQMKSEASQMKSEASQMKDMQKRMMEKIMKLEEEEAKKAKKTKKKKKSRKLRVKKTQNATNATNETNVV